jgi:hypothetical protein
MQERAVKLAMPEARKHRFWDAIFRLVVVVVVAPALSGGSPSKKARATNAGGPLVNQPLRESLVQNLSEIKAFYYVFRPATLL